MVIPIRIDVSELVNQFSIGKEEVKPLVTSILNGITRRIESEWYKASNSLKGTRAEYQKGIYIQKIDYKTAIIGLAGVLPNMVEQGASAFDMKVGFEKSNKKILVVRNKNGKMTSGWYLTIPFRQGIPTTVGDSGAFTGSMPQEIYGVAKKLTDKSQITKAMLPTKYDVVAQRPKIVIEEKVYETYTHKSPIFQGVQKSDKANHGGYVSFRRVSDNSDPDSWIHPGLTAKNFLDKAIQNSDISSIVMKERDKFLDSLGF